MKVWREREGDGWCEGEKENCAKSTKKKLVGGGRLVLKKNYVIGANYVILYANLYFKRLKFDPRKQAIKYYTKVKLQ